MSRIALIDGDAIIFAAGFANERSHEGNLIDLKPEHFAFKKAKDIIARILRDTECTEYRMYLGDTNKSNFRYQVATIQPYKGSRKDQKRPEHEVALRNYLFKYHSAIEVQNCETDDALGIEQTEDTIICTNDKDLDMIPGWHYDLDFGKTRKKKDGIRYKLKAHKTKQMYFISDPGWIDLRRNEENGKQVLCGGGYLWFCCQLLLGDKTDDIPSLSRGYGPVKVYGVLKDCQTEKEGIHAVYKEYCAALKDSLTIEQTQARLMEIAQLVWIKRALNDDIIFKRSWLDE